MLTETPEKQWPRHHSRAVQCNRDVVTAAMPASDVPQSWLRTLHTHSRIGPAHSGNPAHSTPHMLFRHLLSLHFETFSCTFPFGHFLGPFPAQPSVEDVHLILSPTRPTKCEQFISRCELCVAFYTFLKMQLLMGQGGSPSFEDADVFHGSWVFTVYGKQ